MEQAYEKMRRAVERASQPLAPSQFPLREGPERGGPAGRWSRPNYALYLDMQADVAPPLQLGVAARYASTGFRAPARPTAPP